MTNPISSIPFNNKFTKFFIYFYIEPAEISGNKTNGTDIFLHRYRIRHYAAVAILFCKCPFASFIRLSLDCLLSRRSFQAPALVFSPLQSLIVLWTHPLHFISHQLDKLSFHKSSLALIETQPGEFLHFHWTRPFTFFNSIDISFRSLSYLFQLSPLRYLTSDLPLLF